MATTFSSWSNPTVGCYNSCHALVKMVYNFEWWAIDKTPGSRAVRSVQSLLPIGRRMTAQGMPGYFEWSEFKLVMRLWYSGQFLESYGKVPKVSGPFTWWEQERDFLEVQNIAIQCFPARSMYHYFSHFLCNLCSKKMFFGISCRIYLRSTFITGTWSAITV